MEAMQRPADINKAKRRKAARIRHGILLFLRPDATTTPLAPRDLLSIMRNWVPICSDSLFFFFFFFFFLEGGKSV